MWGNHDKQRGRQRDEAAAFGLFLNHQDATTTHRHQQRGRLHRYKITDQYTEVIDEWNNPEECSRCAPPHRVEQRELVSVGGGMNWDKEGLFLAEKIMQSSSSRIKIMSWKWEKLKLEDKTSTSRLPADKNPAFFPLGEAVALCSSRLRYSSLTEEHDGVFNRFIISC